MAQLLKIIITDSAGSENIFVEDPGECENYLDLLPANPNGDCLHGFVKITTRTFSGEKFDSEVETMFLNPRRIDVIYGPHN